MDIMTPELLDLARERGSAFVAIATPSEVIEYSWDSTDARWEDILKWVSMFSKPDVLYVGVVTEGMVVDSQTYEMREHLTMTIVHQDGYESWKIPLDRPVDGITDVALAIRIDPTIDELEFDYEALKAILPW